MQKLVYIDSIGKWGAVVASRRIALSDFSLETHYQINYNNHATPYEISQSPWFNRDFKPVDLIVEATGDAFNEAARVLKVRSTFMGHIYIKDYIIFEKSSHIDWTYDIREAYRFHDYKLMKKVCRLHKGLVTKVVIKESVTA